MHSHPHCTPLVSPNSQMWMLPISTQYWAKGRAIHSCFQPYCLQDIDSPRQAHSLSSTLFTLWDGLLCANSPETGIILTPTNHMPVHMLPFHCTLYPTCQSLFPSVYLTRRIHSSLQNLHKHRTCSYPQSRSNDHMSSRVHNILEFSEWCDLLHMLNHTKGKSCTRTGPCTPYQIKLFTP